MESPSIASLLSQLDVELQKLSQFDVQEILDQLKLVIGSIKSTHQLSRLFDFVFYGKLTIPQKIFIVNHLLVVPSTVSEPLPISWMLRILGSIGKPMQRGAHGVHKGIPINLQLRLLQWLVCCLHFFGEPAKTVRKLLPILFQSLAYEFLRPYLVNLIFLATTGTHGASKPFKKWQIDLVLDLNSRFPLDDSLKVLLLLFKWFEPTLRYRGVRALDLRFTDPHILSYPDPEFLSRIEGIDLNKDILEGNLKQYERFYISVVGRKRVKVMTNSEIDLDLDLDLDIIDFTNTGSKDLISIQEVNSLQELVENIENIQFINIKTIFTSEYGKTARYKMLFSTLLSTHSTKLDYYLRLAFLDENLPLGQFITIIDTLFIYNSHGNQLLSLVKDFVLNKIYPPALTELDVFKARIKLLRFLDLDNDIELSFFNDSTLKLVNEHYDNLLVPFVQEVIFTFTKWHSQLGSSDSFAKILNFSLPKLYSLHIPHIRLILVQILVLLLLNFAKLVDIFHLSESILPSTIVLPPTLVYSLVLSPNPLVFSELCGYISSCKKFQFQPDQNDFKYLQNVYIMDILNLIWRDNTLKYEEQKVSYNKAMLLHPRFVTKLAASDVMNYSNLVRFNLSGNIFHNPTWSYLATEILRTLEDESDLVAIRHAGPPTEESVNLISETKQAWLQVDYDELKLSILRKLDSMGFDGLANLLFTSLKTLSNSR